MVKHQEISHEGAEKPDFKFKTVKYYKTALARQVVEAIRIRRRGGDSTEFEWGVLQVLYPQVNGGGGRQGEDQGSQGLGEADEGAAG